jgi:hypothetical protein
MAALQTFPLFGRVCHQPDTALLVDDRLRTVAQADLIGNGQRNGTLCTFWTEQRAGFDGAATWGLSCCPNKSASRRTTSAATSDMDLSGVAWPAKRCNRGRLITVKAMGPVSCNPYRRLLAGDLMAHWFTQHEHGGLPTEWAAVDGCDLSALHVGGEWHFLVQCRAVSAPV